MACISDRDSVHASKFMFLLLQEGYGPMAISNRIESDLSSDTFEILLTLSVGYDLNGSQKFKAEARATSNNCDRLVTYVALVFNICVASKILLIMCI